MLICSNFAEQVVGGKEDILPYLDLAKAVRPGHDAKRVNVDFPSWMVSRLDLEADRLGVPRQSLIKVWIAERLAQTDRPKLVEGANVKGGSRRP